MLRKTTDNGRMALHLAAIGGHQAVVRLLLEDYKADVEAKTNDGWTALHCAAGGGHEAVVRLLLRDYIRPASRRRLDTVLIVPASKPPFL
jgi:ankyrin repeat protein